MYEWEYAHSRIYRAGLYSKLWVPPTFSSACRSQKNTLGVSDSEVQLQLQFLSSLWLKAMISFLPCRLSHPSPPPARSGMHLLFIKSWSDLVRLPRSILLAFFFQLSHFIAVLDIHYSWCKELVRAFGQGWGKREGWKRWLRWGGLCCSGCEKTLDQLSCSA